jgi:hypothetical protein
MFCLIEEHTNHKYTITPLPPPKKERKRNQSFSKRFKPNINNIIHIPPL